MKKAACLLLIAGLVCALAPGCGAPGPEGTVKDFCDYIDQEEVKSARELLTKEVRDTWGKGYISDRFTLGMSGVEITDTIETKEKDEVWVKAKLERESEGEKKFRFLVKKYGKAWKIEEVKERDTHASSWYVIGEEQDPWEEEPPFKEQEPSATGGPGAEPDAWVTIEGLMSISVKDIRVVDTLEGESRPGYVDGEIREEVPTITGNFALINLHLKNESGEPQEIYDSYGEVSSSLFILRDSAGSMYGALRDTEMFELPSTDGFDFANPGVEIPVSVAFRIPAESRDYSLIVNGWGEDAKYIEYKLGF
ncbi:MAG: DUF4352 domain-containing protein [Actinomycetia bacterium]|nr:DUF4352 domain-containing protein [Actinomycetes bacterium]